jgi:hypothetical protein
VVDIHTFRKTFWRDVSKASPGIYAGDDLSRCDWETPALEGRGWTLDIELFLRLVFDRASAQES